MAKKQKTTDEIVTAALTAARAEEDAATKREAAAPPPGPTGGPTPRLESYIRQHDETPRALATVRLEGGGPGDGTFLVDHPVPRIIAHHAARYTISREEGALSVFIWVNP